MNPHAEKMFSVIVESTQIFLIDVIPELSNNKEKLRAYLYCLYSMQPNKKISYKDNQDIIHSISI